MTLRTAAGMTAPQIAKENGHTECVAAVRTYLGEVTASRREAAGRREAAAVEAGGAGAGISGGEGGSSGPLSEEIGEVGGAPASEAASGASAAASALIGEGGAETEPSSETVPEEVVLAAKRGEEAVVLAWARRRRAGRRDVRVHL